MDAATLRSSALDRWRPLLPAVYWVVTAIGAAWCFLIVFDVVPYGLCGNTGTVPCDAYSYWAVDATPYTWETNLEYRYSPAFLWAIAPLTWMPFGAFLAAWTALHVAAAIWLRVGWILIIPALNEDVLRGNISLFLAVAAVLAIRQSGAWWAPVLLTKVTPGVGIVWHAVRREWRSLAGAVGVTAAIVAIGFVLDAGLWRAWIDTLANADATYEVGHPLGPPLLRVGIAAVVVGFGAWTSRAWLVPVAMFVAVPGLWWFNWALLAAIPRLLERGPAPQS
ncbi:MAG TPA: glycosyltransferase family 87 protein [Candidatus Limnocylindria bacterium]|nr:glycosyltransferase family 87 protein [Candidatus Limnocylindria bacterium]